MRATRGQWAAAALGRTWATQPNIKPIKYNVHADDDQLAFGQQGVLEQHGLGSWEGLRKARVGMLCFQTGTAVCTGESEDVLRWMQVCRRHALGSGGTRGRCGGHAGAHMS